MADRPEEGLKGDWDDSGAPTVVATPDGKETPEGRALREQDAKNARLLTEARRPS